MPFDVLWLSRADRQPLLPGTTFVECPTPKGCVAGADVIITCSPAAGKPRRVIRAERLKHDCLASAVDCDSSLGSDVMTGRLVYRKALQRNVGAWVQL